MTAPLRIQLRRTRGWRMPPNTASVARPTQWGNPYQGDGVCDHAYLVRLYREYSLRLEQADLRAAAQTELRGKNLACWCPLCAAHADGKPLGEQCDACAPCHADVLLELANREDGNLESAYAMHRARGVLSGSITEEG